MVENEAGTPSKRPWSHGPWNSFMGAVAGIYDATGARIGFFNRAEDAEYVVSLSAHIATLEAQLADTQVKLDAVLLWVADHYPDAQDRMEKHFKFKLGLSALEATPAPMVTEDRPTHCGGCGETDPAKRCFGCQADFGPAALTASEAKQ